jgi:hypothetical protein
MLRVLESKVQRRLRRDLPLRPGRYPSATSEEGRLQPRVTALGNKLPAELFNESRSYLVSEATKMDGARLKAIDKREDLKPHIQKIEADLHDLYGYINAPDVDYFHALADPEKYRKMQPMYQPELPITEALMQTYDVWAETPGVFAICQDLSKSWGGSTG